MTCHHFPDLQNFWSVRSITVSSAAYSHSSQWGDFLFDHHRVTCGFKIDNFFFKIWILFEFFSQSFTGFPISYGATESKA